MARKYVNPNRRDAAPGRDPRIRASGLAEWERILNSDPRPWSMILTADLEELLRHADSASGASNVSSIAMNWPELASELASGLKGGRQ